LSPKHFFLLFDLKNNLTNLQKYFVNLFPLQYPGNIGAVLASAHVALTLSRITSMPLTASLTVLTQLIALSGTAMSL
jgi:hypothetical protein